MSGPTAIASSTRYITPGVTKCYWVPAIPAYPGAATRTELTAGSDLTNEIADVAGFAAKTQFVDVPDLSGPFVPVVPGRFKPDPSSLTFYGSKNSVDVRTTLTQGLSGFIVWLDGGDVPTQKMDEFAVTVGAVSVLRNIKGDDVLRGMVDFALTRAPGFNQVIPT